MTDVPIYVDRLKNLNIPPEGEADKAEGGPMMSENTAALTWKRTAKHRVKLKIEEEVYLLHWSDVGSTDSYGYGG